MNWTKAKLLFLSVAAQAVCLIAQPLPKIEITPTFPKLSLQRTMWMSEAPDGSGRFFVVEQDGRLQIVKKGSDGADAKEFLNIVDRKPHMENEEGLLSLAFH